ncbi:MAG TPA: hypothetical protein VNB64_10300 [Solirubrobacteraceae bacterium]|nr:hypothetical protein [Solirubrobacteraceae bacterium]
MSTLATVALVVLAVLALLALGGMLANARRRRALEPRLEASLDEVNRGLAEAHAQDKGWERGALEAAALRAFAERRPGEEVRDHVLVQVIDRPGTDEDKAVFRLRTDGGTAYLTMGRRDGAWVGESVEPA